MPISAIQTNYVLSCFLSDASFEELFTQYSETIEHIIQILTGRGCNITFFGPPGSYIFPRDYIFPKRAALRENMITRENITPWRSKDCYITPPTSRYLLYQMALITLITHFSVVIGFVSSKSNDRSNVTYISCSFNVSIHVPMYING